MSELTDEKRALNVIAVRGPYLCAVSVIHGGWFQTSEEPFELTEDGFQIDANVAAHSDELSGGACGSCPA